MHQSEIYSGHKKEVNLDPKQWNNVIQYLNYLNVHMILFVKQVSKFWLNDRDLSNVLFPITSFIFKFCE